MTRTADRFSNRSAAGRLLAEKLAERAASYRAARPLVLALPRGGLLVGVELARAFATPLDVLVARRIWAPGRPQLAIGAVAPGGVCVLFEERIAELGISPRYVELVAAEVTLEAELATERYRAGYPPLELGGRTVFVVEDGLASGATAAAALEAARREGAGRLVLVTPVASLSGLERIRSRTDEVCCLRTVANFGMVSDWYEDFSPPGEDEVLLLLRQARHGGGEARWGQ